LKGAVLNWFGQGTIFAVVLHSAVLQNVVAPLKKAGFVQFGPIIVITTDGKSTEMSF